MRLTFTLALLLFGVTTTASAAEPCRQVHGRADFYSGDGQMFVWHIGTHHLFWILDDPSQEMIFKYIPYEPNSENFICPTASYKPGEAQSATVQQIKHPRIVPH